MSPIKLIKKINTLTLKQVIQSEIEGEIERLIVWYPSCEGCTKKECDKPKSYQQELHDARECENFTPHEYLGVFIVENKDKEKIFLKTVNNEVIYVSKAESKAPICSFRLKDWHRPSTRNMLQEIVKLEKEKANEIIAEISLYEQAIRMEMRKTSQNENDITDFLLTPPLTEEEIVEYKAKAEEWLKNPKLLLLIKQALDIKIVGEIENKLTSFLSAGTRVLSKENKVHVIPRGPSAVGKSWIETNALRLFPNVLDFTRITATAPDYLTDIDLANYIIYIREMKGIETANYSLRVLMSEGGLKLLSVVKDPKTGKLKRTVIRVKGTPVFHSTLAFGYIEEQMFTRVLDYTPDESKFQTRQILRYQGKDFATVFNEPFSEDEMILRYINQTMTPIHVVVPYAPKLAEIFSVDKIRARRDFPKLISFIMSITSYYREQRFKLTLKHDNGTSETIVVANLDDLQFAIAIVWGILAKTMTALEKPVINFYETLRKAFENKKFTKRDASKVTNKSENTCRSYLWKLSKDGFLITEKMEGSKQDHIYSFSSDKITIPTLWEKVTEFTQKDFKRFLMNQCNINQSEKEFEDYYKRWQGLGDFKVEELFALKIEIEADKTD
jgi:hypothetical protein